MSDRGPEAPGWAAIDSAATRLHPGTTPHQFASKTPYEPSSLAPLPAVTVWETPSGWHHVGYGLSELFEKSSADPEVSGFGFELTVLTPRLANEDRPPAFGVRLIQGLARHVLEAREGFDSGHVIDLGSPVAPGSVIVGLICVPDLWLGKILGPFGAVLFLRIVGVTEDELAIAKSLDLQEKVAMLAELDPLARLDTSRRPWSEDPERSKVLARYRLGIRW